jgi:ferredoxin-nitrite reductase
MNQTVSATNEFSPEQKRYLEGFFAGIKARGVSFVDLNQAPPSDAQKPDIDDLTKEERIKRELHPLDAYTELLMDAKSNKAPDSENIFRYKWEGLFWLSPVANAYMCRLKIPGGIVQATQLREVAAISRELTSGYIQITTRNNLQLRLIQPKDCPEVLRRIQAVGLQSRGSGADNIRNITASPTAGFDPHELYDVRPLVSELHQIISSSRDFFNLPRKFNIALDGGGLVSTVEDTNDIGAKAVIINDNEQGIKPGIYFRIALGGVTGHQTFASDWGVIVPPEQLVQVILAILRVFIRDGDRTNRKKARLKYLLERRGLATFLEDCEKLLPFALQRLTEDSSLQQKRGFSQSGHHHIGAYAQKQSGLYYIGASVPVGQINAKQLERVATLAENYGSGEIRLTVWQNFILPNIPEEYVATVSKQLEKMGFATAPSNLRTGFVACTGNRYCKYSSTDTKGHAIQVMEYLDKRLKLDHPVNIHFTGCPHSCAQHYMGDIGLLGTTVKLSGESMEGYHVTVGGGFGENQKIGRLIFQGVPFAQLKTTLETMLKGYLLNRSGQEKFQEFCNRHDVNALQRFFSENG